MRVFVDTSAFLTLIDQDENNFSVAKMIWQQLVMNEEILSTSNYVLLETNALIQRRFGMGHVQAFEDNVVPLLQIEWVDQSTHQAAVHAMLTANRRQLSLVDCISFEVCRQLGIKDVSNSKLETARAIRSSRKTSAFFAISCPLGALSDGHHRKATAQ